MKNIGRLHVLTDTLLQDRFTHVDLARLAVAGGAGAIQYRQKQGSTLDMIETAKQMIYYCKKEGSVFIVNDRIDVALASKADGVHLGQDDFPIGLARELLGPEKIIGGSASSLEEALICVKQGADYVGFGPVFPTSSKDDAGPVSGIETLRLLCSSIDIPVIAIGGIFEGNLAEVMGAGAYGAAVISSVCCKNEPEDAARSLSMIIESCCS